MIKHHLFAVFCVLLAWVPVAADAQGNDRIEIRLEQATFDPLHAPPVLPPQLSGMADAPLGRQYYLVQFEGPVRREWRTELARLGADILDYVPDFAYIVRMDEQALTEVRRFAPVRWTGPFHPGFRLSSDLYPLLDASRSDVAIELIVRLFRDEPAAVLAASLARWNATWNASVVAQNDDSGGGAAIRLWVPETALTELARVAAVAWIEPYREPIFLNDVARSEIAMNKDGLEAVLGLYGENQIVAVGDSGLSTGNPDTVHRDFEGRVVGGSVGSGASCGTAWADNHGHGTHVAGSAVGSGFHSGADIPGRNYAGSNAGIAPEALLYVWGFCADFSGVPGAPYSNYYGVMRDADPRLRVNTNSWGWDGTGQYNTFTRETDRFIWDFPDMVVLYAAGNSGRDTNGDGVINPSSTSMPATGKNVITVGASENLRLSGGFNPDTAPCSTWGGCWPGNFPAEPIRDDRLSDNIDGMAAFSSRGPTSSGRLKPDIVAPGTNILSTSNENTPPDDWAEHDDYYRYNLGTSMATPLVAGASAIVREFYEVTYAMQPGAALVKATLINGAFDMTPGQYGAGATQDVVRRPDINQGWGRVDLPNTLIHEGARELWFHEHTGLDTGESYEMSFTVVNSDAPFRATLVWVDYPGIEATHGALVNDLDMEVQGPDGTVYTGNAVLTGGMPDRHNNVEGVDVVTPDPGVYTVTIHGFNVPQGAQPFALVVTGELVEGSGPDFFMNASPEAATICAGEPASYDINIRGVLGYDDAVTLAVTGGLPAGATAAFSVNPVIPADPPVSSVLTVENTADALHDDYELLVEGSAGESVKQSGLHLRVFDAAPGSLVPTQPVQGAINVPLRPTLSWDGAAQAVTYDLEIATDAAFGDIIYHASTAATQHTVPEDLPSNVQLFWRVRAGNVCGENSSGTRAFVTVGLPGECSFGSDTLTYFFDDMAGGAPGWTQEGQASNWMLQDVHVHSPTHAWHAPSPSAVSDQRLITPPVEIPPGEFGYTLQFQNHYALESAASGCFDGALLEVSTDSGASWTQVSASLMLTNPYHDTIHTGFGNPAEDMDAWCGQTEAWTNTVVDLEAYVGHTVQFRFRLATNKSVGHQGWYIDDVKVQSCRPGAPQDMMFRDRFESNEASDES